MNVFTYIYIIEEKHLFLTSFSNVLCSESKAAVTSVFVIEAQLQKSLTSICGEMNAYLSYFSAMLQTSTERS